MDTGSIDSMNGPHSGDDGRHGRTGDLVNETAERRVFLRRPPNHSERPNRSVTMIDSIHIENRKIVREAVVPQVISEGTLRQQPVRVDGPGDAEVSFGIDGQAVRRANHRNPAPLHGAGEGQFRQPFGQRHHGGQHHGG